MLLETAGLYNDLSPEMRKRIYDKVVSFGKTVRYKFNIGRPNPDPLKYNGDTIWPYIYTLDPSVFTITDRSDKRENKLPIKRIGLVKATNDKGDPVSFYKIQVHERDRGVISLDLSKEEDRYKAMFLELHPKHSGGDFADSAKHQVFSRIDEKAASTTQRTERTARLKALNAAQAMSDKELIDFADAMMWDSSEEPDILRNKIETLAETTPEFFNDLVSGKSIEYQSAVQQGLNKKIISFDPAEYKMVWSGNNQTLTMLPPNGEKNHIEKMAEWFQTGGDRANQSYRKLKELIK